MQTKQNELLNELNTVYANSDEMFYRMEERQYSDETCDVLIAHLKDVNLTLSKINAIK